MIPKMKITDKGIMVPTTEEVLTGLWDLFLGAFGPDLNKSMSTPQGQLITSLSAIIQDERNQMVELMNQMDPKYSRGIWQEGIGNIYFLKRKQKTYSTAVIKVLGLSGALIRSGTLLQDTNGYIWRTLKEVQINQSGVAFIDVECTTSGVIEAVPNSITALVKMVPGVDRVSNEKSAVVGGSEESRIDFEQRRQLSVAANSKNMNASTYGAVSDLDGVLSVYVEDNPTDNTVYSGLTQYPLIRNSILVSVVGGSDRQIAKTILEKAGTGCSFNGNTSVKVRDIENFEHRPPAYDIQFLRPASKPVFFQVKIDDLSAITFNDENKISTALVNASKTGRTKMMIGTPVLAIKFVCELTRSSDVVIESLRISYDDIHYTDVLDFGVDEYPFTSAGHVRFI